MKLNESQEPKSRAVALEEGKAGEDANPAKSEEGQSKKLEIHCDKCKELIEDLASQVKHKLAKRGFIAVGIVCPHCEAFFHSYYTTPDLEAGRTIFERFQKKANRSPEDWQRYQRKRVLFQRKHDRVQAEAKKVMGLGESTAPDANPAA